MNEQSSPQQPTEVIALPTFQAQFRLGQPNFEETPAIYANFAQATIAQHDLTLFFGWYATPPLTEAPSEVVDVTVRPLGAVTLPVGLIPALIQALNAQAAAWEESHGQKLPPPPQPKPTPADEGDES